MDEHENKSGPSLKANLPPKAKTKYLLKRRQ